MTSSQFPRFIPVDINGNPVGGAGSGGGSGSLDSAGVKTAIEAATNLQQVSQLLTQIFGAIDELEIKADTINVNTGQIEGWLIEIAGQLSPLQFLQRDARPASGHPPGNPYQWPADQRRRRDVINNTGDENQNDAGWVFGRYGDPNVDRLNYDFVVKPGETYTLADPQAEVYLVCESYSGISGDFILLDYQ